MNRVLEVSQHAANPHYFHSYSQRNPCCARSHRGYGRRSPYGVAPHAGLHASYFLLHVVDGCAKQPPVGA